MLSGRLVMTCLIVHWDPNHVNFMACPNTLRAKAD